MYWKRWKPNEQLKTALLLIAMVWAILYGPDLVSRNSIGGGDWKNWKILKHIEKPRPALRHPRMWQIKSPEVKGQVAFGAPNAMTQGEEQMVVVRISLDRAEDLTKGLPPKSAATVDTIDVVPNMTVKLDDGKDFTIVALTPENQFIARDRFTEWEFSVTALESGTHELHLHVGIRTKIGLGEIDERFYPVYEHKILVQVDRIYVVHRFWSENWKWIIGTLCLPVIWYVVKKQDKKKDAETSGDGKKREKNSEDDEDEKPKESDDDGEDGSDVSTPKSD